MYENMIVVSIDRDSVHAGDDLHSHETSIKVEHTTSMRRLLERIQAISYLPGIHGGEATWIICSPAGKIGVLAQQWHSPKLTIPLETLVAEHFRDQTPRLLFRYWGQKNPEQIFSQIRAGAEPG